MIEAAMKTLRETARPAIGPAGGLKPGLIWATLAFFILALAAPFSATAQLTGKGAITGTVMDKTGAAIPGAAVIAISDATGINTKTESTGAGAFNLANLDPGMYTVVIEAKGFQKLVQKNLHVNATETQVYNPALTVGAADVEVTVTAEPPQLETSNATLGATMENETYSELPLEMGAYGQADQRRATDFVYLMPGVQGNETNGNATTNVGVVNGSGNRGAVSAVYIDGIPFVRAGGNGDPRFVWTAISVDAIDQFQVQTVGYPAIYEGQGVMNYTVKRGGQKYHASVYEFFRNTALDTWGWFGKIPNPATGIPVKPIEHSNEYGINLSGPLVPFGGWKDKVFYFGNYNGYRYSSATPTPMSFPTESMKAGNFSAFSQNIYDPLTQVTVSNGATRTAYGGAAAGNNCAAGVTRNCIPTSEFSKAALALQQFLPTVPDSAGTGNNYVAQNPTGLTNWSTTHRIDYVVNERDTLSFLAAIGRQASSVPVGQSTSGRNVGPIPYNYGQVYAPKTAVGAIEETHVFSPTLLNQIKYGFARYYGPTFNANALNTANAASTLGFGGLPAGQTVGSFPIVTFSGNGSPTNWGGTSANVTTAENFTLLDNVQWTVGKHSFTFGGQIAWMLYNVLQATGGTTPVTLANAVSETANFSTSSGKPTFTTVSNTGLAYASFLLGEFDKGSFTQYLQTELGTRFRAVSGYAQDNWKITPKLTADIGLRYDFFPPLHEAHNAQAFFNPNLANPVTGINGALQFAGTETNTCNCSTPVNAFYKNIGPRLGLAYQLDSKTVIRASYGLMFTHGGGVGGGVTSLGVLGFSSAPSISSVNSSTTLGMTGTGMTFPAYTVATGSASGPAYGTGYTTTAGYTGSPSGMGYADPYLGGRAPEFLNWSFGLQHQFTNSITATVSYVGTEGHFVQPDGSNINGYWADQLDPKYLSLGSLLSDTSTARTADCTNNSLPCPAGLATSQALSTALKPFPFQSVSNTFYNVANTNYHAVQAQVNMRTWHGLTVGSNFTFSRAIDDAGNFRTGYAIPAGFVVNQPNKAWKADAIERSVSASNQPLHYVATVVWATPFGKTILNSNHIETAILSGFKLSGVFQAFSGSPLTITGNACQTNPAQSACVPTLNSGFTGSARQHGKWGKGVNWSNYSLTQNSQPLDSNTFIVPSYGYATQTTVGSASPTTAITIAPSGPFISPTAIDAAEGAPASGTSVTTGGVTTKTASVSLVSNTSYAPAYTFGNASRTAPYNLYGPGNYQLDLALVRTFRLHITESSKLDFRAEWYNVTNHTLFGVASTAVGSTTFGQVTQSNSANRKAAQFSARIEF